LARPPAYPQLTEVSGSTGIALAQFQ